MCPRGGHRGNVIKGRIVVWGAPTPDPLPFNITSGDFYGYVEETLLKAQLTG